LLFKSQFPACDVHCWNKDVATDCAFFCNPPAHHNGILGNVGSTIVQLFAGKTSSRSVVYPMHLTSNMPGTLEDLLHQHGLPNRLFSDNAKVQHGKHICNLLHLYRIKDFQSEGIKDFQSEPHQKIGDTKHFTDAIMDRTGMSACFWLICLLYAVFFLTHLASNTLDGFTSIKISTGQRTEILPLLKILFVRTCPLLC
jgi:hypothetical protein